MRGEGSDARETLVPKALDEGFSGPALLAYLRATAVGLAAGVELGVGLAVLGAMAEWLRIARTFLIRHLPPLD